MAGTFLKNCKNFSSGLKTKIFLNQNLNFVLKTIRAI